MRADPPALRDGVLEDVRAIAEVHVAAWQAAYQDQLPAEFLAGLSVEAREHRWRALFRDGNVGSVIVATTAEGDRAGTVVGFAAVGASRDVDADTRTGEVYSLYLHPDEWGRGIGRSLLVASLARLGERGHQKATLWVLATNVRARRFYEAGGWTIEAGMRKSESLGEDVVDQVGNPVVLHEVRYRRALGARCTS